MERDENPTELVLIRHGDSRWEDCGNLPAVVAEAGSSARFAYDEFFAGLDSPHTIRAYRAVVHRFLAHCESRGVRLHEVTPGLVSEYIRTLEATQRDRGDPVARAEPASKPTRKLHLAAIRRFFDKAVERHAVVLNPAASVRGPRYSVAEGKTPAIDPKQARRLLASIDPGTPAGLRDRAVIATLIFTAARVGAVAKLTRGDFHTDGRQFYLRLDEKGGKRRTIPCRTDLQQHIEEYLASGQALDDRSPLFRSVRARSGELTHRPMSANDMLRMVKRRLLAAGLPASQFACHSFRAGTATNLLDQGVELADVQFLLGHSDPRTTKLYDRRGLSVTRNIVERIAI